MSLLSVLSGIHFMSTLQLSRAQFPGPAECILNDANDNQCPVSNGAFTTYDNSEIECSEDYSCCYCDSITCADCEKFLIDGDKGAIGVTPIEIVGEADNGGVKIECTGLFFVSPFCTKIPKISATNWATFVHQMFHFCPSKSDWEC